MPTLTSLLLLFAASLYTVGSDGKQLAEGKKKVEVIDLTLDSSSDEEEPPAKKPFPLTTAAIPSAAGTKGWGSLCVSSVGLNLLVWKEGSVGA